jgi:hypothetical protein
MRQPVSVSTLISYAMSCSTRSSRVQTGLIGAGACVLAALAYNRLLRPRIVNWGATPEEASATIPGDALLAGAEMVATRAITIDAPPSAIWPWLVQMGVGRGGAYTYDWIERLFGLDMRSVERIVPELQHLQVGDVLPMRPGDPGMRIEILEPQQAMVARSEDGAWVWAFALQRHNGSTRLISRNRARVRSTAERAGMAAMEIGSLVMERKMLEGIKQRAERGAAEHVPLNQN